MGREQGGKIDDRFAFASRLLLAACDAGAFLTRPGPARPLPQSPMDTDRPQAPQQAAHAGGEGALGCDFRAGARGRQRNCAPAPARARARALMRRLPPLGWCCSGARDSHTCWLPSFTASTSCVRRRQQGGRDGCGVASKDSLLRRRARLAPQPPPALLTTQAVSGAAPFLIYSSALCVAALALLSRQQHTKRQTQNNTPDLSPPHASLSLKTHYCRCRFLPPSPPPHTGRVRPPRRPREPGDRARRELPQAAPR